jgi:hypothetical protein
VSEYLAESRRIRAEQDRAYAESLAADQAKEKAKVCMCARVKNKEVREESIERTIYPI